jgi:tRNA 2-thiouridine synthesizing protein A
MMVANRKLDLRGEVCPYPQIYTLRELGKMEVGQILEVITDHLPSIENVPAAVTKQGHEVLEVSKINAGVYKILIKKAKK